MIQVLPVVTTVVDSEVERGRRAPRGDPPSQLTTRVAVRRTPPTFVRMARRFVTVQQYPLIWLLQQLPEFLAAENAIVADRQVSQG